MVMGSSALMPCHRAVLLGERPFSNRISVNIINLFCLGLKPQANERLPTNFQIPLLRLPVGKSGTDGRLALVHRLRQVDTAVIPHLGQKILNLGQAGVACQREADAVESHRGQQLELV